MSIIEQQQLPFNAGLCKHELLMQARQNLSQFFNSILFQFNYLLIYWTSQFYFKPIELLLNILDSYINCRLKIWAVVFLLRSQEVIWVFFLKIHFYWGLIDILIVDRLILLCGGDPFLISESFGRHLKNQPRNALHY